jgi:hypothetical protein
MKPFRLNLDSSELLVGNFNSGFVFFSTQFRFDTQAASGDCAADKPAVLAGAYYATP